MPTLAYEISVSILNIERLEKNVRSIFSVKYEAIIFFSICARKNIFYVKYEKTFPM